ncbi:MAG TPA: lipoyl(octanoyl) transferase LipB [Balneolaceae bacterium]|nr:lipoyl(octanoyl) transferase LipB [Balneolaceae bacterium]
MQTVELYDLGCSDYKPAWDLQTAIQQRLIKQKRAFPDAGSDELDPEVLLFVEHPHVYTLGKSGDSAHLLKGMAELADLDAKYIEIDRGGDITYHGPGQIVGYPILDLDRHFTDIHKYMRSLEEVVILTCNEYGIKAGRIEGLTGVWVDDAKICAMGVRCSRWVTMHGFALNVNTDLSYFNHIIPCGIIDKEVTSLKKILGRPVEEKDVKKYLAGHFQDVFEVNVREGTSLPELNNEFSYLKRNTEQTASQ